MAAVVSFCNSIHFTDDVYVRSEVNVRKKEGDNKRATVRHLEQMSLSSRYQDLYSSTSTAFDLLISNTTRWSATKHHQRTQQQPQTSGSNHTLSPHCDSPCGQSHFP
jgi:hypothetical protein